MSKSFSSEVSALGAALAKASTALVAYENQALANDHFAHVRKVARQAPARATLFAAPTLAKRRTNRLAAALGAGNGLFKGLPKVPLESEIAAPAVARQRASRSRSAAEALNNPRKPRQARGTAQAKPKAPTPSKPLVVATARPKPVSPRTAFVAPATAPKVTYRGNYLGKGYPEYNASQERNPDGTWAAGSVGGVHTTPKGKALAGKLPGFMAKVPKVHKQALEDMPIYVVHDVGNVRAEIDQRIGRTHQGAGRSGGLFMPEVGLFVGDTFDGFKVANPRKTLIHEFGHAFDYYADPHQEFLHSEELADTIAFEIDALPAVTKFYSEHYHQQAQWKAEVFAEVYAALYSTDDMWHQSYFMGGLTRQQVLKNFPSTATAIKRLVDEPHAGFKSTARTSEWNNWFTQRYATDVTKGYPE